MLRLSILALSFATLLSAQATVPLQLPALQGRPFVRVNPMGDNSPDNNFQNNQDLLLTPDGKLHVVWVDYTGTAGRDVYMASSRDEGFSFSPMVRVDLGNAPGASDAQKPKIVKVDDGNPLGTFLVFWEDNRANLAASGGALNTDLFYNRSVDGGQTWLLTSLPLNTDTLSNLTTAVDRVQIAVDGSTVHVIWLENVGCNQCYEQLRYVRSVDAGMTWTAPTVLNTQVRRVGPSGNPQLQFNDVDEPKITALGGRVFIAFLDDRNDRRANIDPRTLTDAVYRLYSPDGGVNWIEGLLETDITGDASELALSRDGTTIAVAWVDSVGTPLGAVRVALSGDDGLSFAPEIGVSPLLESTYVFSKASETNVAISGPQIAVVWGDTRGLVIGTEDVRRSYTSISTDLGQTWVTELQLDPAPGRLNQGARVKIAGETVFYYFEINGFGSNRAAFSITNDGGVSFTAPHVITIGAGTDVDTADQHEFTAFVVSEAKRKAWALFRDRPLGRNEVYVTGIGAPYATLAGASDTDGLVQVTPGATVNFALRSAPPSAINFPVFFAIGQSGSTPPISVPGSQALVHLNIDSLTAFVLGTPLLFPLVSVQVGGDGNADAFPFPWPLPLGSPNLTLVALVVDSLGQIRYASDPATILTQ